MAIRIQIRKYKKALLKVLISNIRINAFLLSYCFLFIEKTDVGSLLKPTSVFVCIKYGHLTL